MITEKQISSYVQNGFVSPLRFLSEEQTAVHRRTMESAESKVGKLHYKAKVYTILQSPFELATLPDVLDVVERLIGPDILIYNAEYLVKEPQTPSFVSWHQDLTYWGFDSDDLVSMWLALSPATQESGCMRMIPGSHAGGMMEHIKTRDENNVLYQGQTVAGVDESESVVCALQPGEASFHHGWTLHASMPNHSNDRRIGLNVTYLRPSMRQLKYPEDSAVLVRGSDNYGHFLPDRPATRDLDAKDLERFKALNEVYLSIAADGEVAT